MPEMEYYVSINEYLDKRKRLFDAYIAKQHAQEKCIVAAIAGHKQIPCKNFMQLDNMYESNLIKLKDPQKAADATLGGINRNNIIVENLDDNYNADDLIQNGYARYKSEPDKDELVGFPYYVCKLIFLKDGKIEDYQVVSPEFELKQEAIDWKGTYDIISLEQRNRAGLATVVQDYTYSKKV